MGAFLETRSTKELKCEGPRTRNRVAGTAGSPGRLFAKAGELIDRRCEN